MKRIFLVLLMMFSLIFTSCFSDDYESFESNFENKTVNVILKDKNGKVKTDTPVYAFSEKVFETYGLNIEYANVKGVSDKKGTVIFEDLFSKIVEGDNPTVNIFTIYVKYSVDNQEKTIQEKITLSPDYNVITMTMICD